MEVQQFIDEVETAIKDIIAKNGIVEIPACAFIAAFPDEEKPGWHMGYLTNTTVDGTIFLMQEYAKFLLEKIQTEKGMDND